MSAVIVLAYAVPIASQNSSVQWDAVDVHYSAQKYFAERVLAGELPHWTPYLFAGFPFLADPQTGAWYPGNWPFFAAGIGPRALEVELALHALLAALGTFFLIRQWLGEPASAFGALCYALGGFFAGHSSHLGIFQAAALLPWLLLTLVKAVDGDFSKNVSLGAVTGGCLILVGHFQTALYSFAATALFAAGIAVMRRGHAIRRAFAFLGIVGIASLALSAIQTLPGLELTLRSARAGADYSRSTEGVLAFRSLMTLVFPDALGALSGRYRGPGDVTQYYFYSGVLLLPFALFGLRNARLRWIALGMGVPALLYMAGPDWVAFRLISWAPGFRNVRAPVHAWFIAALALAVLAAAGVDRVVGRWRWAGVVATAILAVDLCNNNVWSNGLAYAHQSFQSLYAGRLEFARTRIMPSIPAFTRLEGPDQLAAFGPMNHPLDLRLETTYGYNPLALSTFAEFRQAAARNSKLRDSLGVSRVMNPTNGTLEDNASRLPRAYFPAELIIAGSEAESRKILDTLDPPRQAVLTARPASVQQDPSSTVTIQANGEQAYRLSYHAMAPSVVRVALPYYPGWVATVDGRPCDLLKVDHAMTAIVVPAGDKQIELHFRPTYFRLGAMLSGFACLALIAIWTIGTRQNAA